MHDEIDFDEIINNYRNDPYEYIDVHTMHTGKLRFQVEPGSQVEGPSGEWRHIRGTALYELNRERNLKPYHSNINGEIASIRNDLEGRFVEAGEKIITIKHPLKKREIIDKILKRVLFQVKAPERAKYFFAMDIQARIDKYGQRQVQIKRGEELFTMSLMKRESPVYYEGEPGLIHSVYFNPGESFEQGETLIGVCPKEKMPLIEKIITRVKAEWD